MPHALEAAADSSPAPNTSPNRAARSPQDTLPERGRLIVAAAYDLLQDQGLEGLTIRAVLNRTGLSRRAFYERFVGKDDLVLAVFEETIRVAARHYGALIRSLADPLAQLELIITWIALAKSSPEGPLMAHGSKRGAAMSREHMRLAESRPDDLQQALKPLIDLIAQVLADGMAAGVMRCADPQRLATLVYNLVSTTVHTELLAQEAGPYNQARREELATDLWEFCRRAVAP